MAAKEPSPKGFEARQKRDEELKLNEKDFKIIDYISDHFEEPIDKAKMSKALKITRPTIDMRLHLLRKAGIIKYSWKVNPYALDSTIILFLCRIAKGDPEKVVNLIHKKEFVKDIYHLHPNEFMLELIVSNLSEFRVIRKLLSNQNIEMIDSWVALDKMSESQPGKFMKRLKDKL